MIIGVLAIYRVTSDSALGKLLVMANELLAAFIQGCCTMAAAGIAVRGAIISLRSWSTEVPGRRRLELAEQCLASAYSVNGLISDFSYEVRSYIRDDLTLGDTGWTPSEREGRYRELSKDQHRIREALDTLQNVSRMTDLYFEQDLRIGHGLMADYYRHWADQLLKH